MNEQERMQFFHEIFHSSLARLGPGTVDTTLRALNTVLSAAGPREAGAKPRWPRVLDLGCGTGAQSLVLAGHLDGRILAVDNHQPFLDALRRRAEAAGVSGKIETRLQDMRTFAPGEGSFDVIWSEGALYSMGFTEGLDRCRLWLAEDGFLVVSELCWLKADPPAECRSFLEDAYPVITDVETNLRAMQARGYTILDHFILPESAWRDEFYDPLESRLRVLRPRYAGDAERLDMIELIQTEIDNYRNYGAYFGYVCCVLRR